MKKIILVSVLSLGSLLASSGEEIFKTNCVSCHMMQKGKDIADKSKMLAPPVFGIVRHTKEVHPTKEAFVAFVSDYIKNPSKDKAVCQKKAIDRFGLMPAVGQGMKDEDIKEVSEWLYDNIQSGSGKGRGKGQNNR